LNCVTVFEGGVTGICCEKELENIKNNVQIFRKTFFKGFYF
jgi:hypothetical protein